MFQVTCLFVSSKLSFDRQRVHIGTAYLGHYHDIPEKEKCANVLNRLFSGANMGKLILKIADE